MARTAEQREQHRQASERYRQKHKQKVLACYRKYNEEHREQRKLYCKEWREKHKQREQAKSRKYYYENRAYCRALMASYQEKHRVRLCENTKRFYLRAKVEVLTHYSGGKLTCVRCGFADVRALSIDHIHGGGYKYRVKGHGAAGGRFYALLRQQGFPDGYQTLCMNCQFIKRWEEREYGDNYKGSSRRVFDSGKEAERG